MPAVQKSDPQKSAAKKAVAKKSPAKAAVKSGMPAKKRSAAKTSAKPSAKSTAGASKSMPASGKDPKGGLTATGRAFYNQKEGSNLRPGVTGPANTPEKKKRKGSFLTRHFTHPRGPIEKDGEPTRLALSAHAWGEPVPKNESAAKTLAAKGRKLLEQYHKEKDEPQSPKKAGAKAEK